MKKRLCVFLFMLALFLSFLPTAYANSSWDIYGNVPPGPGTLFLPIAVIVTLLVETFGILWFSGIKTARGRIVTVAAVCTANLASYIMPYLSLYNNSYHLFYLYVSLAKVFDLDYIITLTYLFFTLIIEIPIVYLVLQNRVENKKRLLVTIFAVNTITTLFVAVTERILYTAPSAYL
ncbi:MAG: hypothetical protein ACOYU3_09870 [Bacillota bacterium]